MIVAVCQGGVHLSQASDAGARRQPHPATFADTQPRGDHAHSNACAGDEQNEKGKEDCPYGNVHGSGTKGDRAVDGMAIMKNAFAKNSI